MSIQPALINGSSEYWKDGDIRYKLTNGQASEISNLPDSLKVPLKAELDNDLQAQKGLDRLGIHNDEDRLLKFFDCNYSLFDSIPDIDLSGNLGKREFISCCDRGICLAEGETCRFPNGLSKKESRVAKCIALGFTDAQICYDLDIAQDTLRNHKNNIERKIDQKGKPAIASWATQNNFI